MNVGYAYKLMRKLEKWGVLKGLRDPVNGKLAFRPSTSKTAQLVAEELRKRKAREIEKVLVEVTVVRSTTDADVGKKRESILRKIIEYGKRNRQLGMFLFIYYWYSEYKEGVNFKRLWRFYNSIAPHIVSENTVRKQLELLQNKGLVEIKGSRIYPKVF